MWYNQSPQSCCFYFVRWPWEQCRCWFESDGRDRGQRMTSNGRWGRGPILIRLLSQTSSRHQFIEQASEQYLFFYGPARNFSLSFDQGAQMESHFDVLLLSPSRALSNTPNVCSQMRSFHPPSLYRCKTPGVETS